MSVRVCDRATFCPQCYANIRGRSNRKGHRGYRTPPRPFQHPYWETMAMRKPTAAPGDEGRRSPPGLMFSELGSLHEYLTNARWDDGSERELATLTMFAAEGRWRVCLNDRATDRVCFYTADTAEQAMLDLDEDLSADTVAWRVSKPPQRRGSGNRS